jgi:hypothetical protein
MQQVVEKFFVMDRNYGNEIYIQQTLKNRQKNQIF